MSTLIWSSDTGEKGSYEVDVLLNTNEKFVFVDVNKKGVRRELTLLPTPSGKLHSHTIPNSNPDWCVYVGSLIGSALNGRWRRDDDAYGKEGDFEIRP